jgi:hypothetical protein
MQSSFAPGAAPYALSSPAFRFRALASLAGRAPLGGAREVALAAYLVARLVDDCLPEKVLPLTSRVERSAAAKGWLASMALPGPVRGTLTKLVEATAGDLSDVSPTLATVIAVTTAFLDIAARTELDRLAQHVTADRPCHDPVPRG